MTEVKEWKCPITSNPARDGFHHWLGVKCRCNPENCEERRDGNGIIICPIDYRDGGFINMCSGMIERKKATSRSLGIAIIHQYYSKVGRYPESIGELQQMLNSVYENKSLVYDPDNLIVVKAALANGLLYVENNNLLNDSPRLNLQLHERRLAGIPVMIG